MDPFSGVATVLLDGEGTVLRWSRAAAALLDRPAAEVCGRPLRDLLAPAGDPYPASPGDGTGAVLAGRAALRHRSGRAVEVVLQAQRLDGSPDVLLLAAPLESGHERNASVARTLLTQDVLGICVCDTALTVARSSLDPARVPWVREQVTGRPLTDLLAPEDAENTAAILHRVLRTGVPAAGLERWVRAPGPPERRWALSLSAFRTEDAAGRPDGVVVVLTDITEHLWARRYLDLRHEAAVRIGDSLDVTRTAQDLVDVLVPALGDLAWVSLAEPVLSGDDPPKLAGAGDWHMYRVAVASTGPWPAGLPAAGTMGPPVPDAPLINKVQSGETVIVPDRADALAMVEEHPELLSAYIPEGGHTAVAAPLFARGLVLGAVVVWRIERPGAFDQADAGLLTEIATRGALSVDNARRYTREHRAAVALQQRLLPRPTTDTPAAATAGVYRPASGGVSIGGDWFDVIPLPSLRVALVIGDVVGHGLHAAATMGRIRAAIRTLAELEMEPDEVLAHVDDLLQQLAQEAPRGQAETLGGSCLYAVYDPVGRRCSFASAGHPPPLMVTPDGSVATLAVSPGPPLGVGGMPFEVTEIELPPDSVLALYTDGLIRRGTEDIDTGIDRLTEALGGLVPSGRTLDEAGHHLLTQLAGDAPSRDDIALLLARTRVIAPERVACWEFPAEPGAVAGAREAVARRLTAWGLDHLVFTTELLVSELVTNAVRYAGGPIGVQLLYEGVLVCEVSDPSNTQPRLRRARSTDEGGRGLFLVAQFTTRWGCRYGQSGKTIWAEQSLAGADGTTAGG
ncbi:ATP-binding SpoIIE family protein phosphatase [Streptomyces sp. NRRL S-118]|uniref:ATP-binding SpoIIE family protein phosphatase n=1 Tax=Streptomyces sp. NRRL S-118 TaxID=1463881 RepID=UPI0004CA6700|nr:SpoIIE family protein phosphatase [Streptomyces sp. NRRL S-118]